MFYGWRVVAGAFLAQLFVVGFFTYAVSLLVGPVREEFGVSLEQVMYSMTLATLLGLVLSPLAGVLIDRMPVRWLMATGGSIYGAGLYALSYADSIMSYILIFGVTVSIANAFSGSVCASAVIARWFTVNRGKAMGIAAIGTSVGGVLVPALLSAWLATGGWRGALQYFAVAILLVMLPAIILLVRGRPADVGLEPEPSGSDASHGATDERVLQLPDILRNPAFWSIGLSLGLLFAAYTAILSNLTPYATGHGLSAEQASTLIMVVAIGGLAGKILFGILADSIALRTGLWIGEGLVVIAFLILAQLPGYPVMLFACAVLGLAQGGMLPVWGAMMAQAFGLASYGRAMGLMGPIITLCVMPSFPLVGRLYDASGGYVSSLYLFSGVALVAALLLLPLRLGQDQPAAEVVRS